MMTDTEETWTRIKQDLTEAMDNILRKKEPCQGRNG